MKIYIAGQITGNPNFMEHFQRIEDYLVSWGHQVMNPAKLPVGFGQADYMQVCLSMINPCDAVFLLSNWEKSEGATIEKLYAEKTGKQMYYEKDYFKAGEEVKCLG